MCSAVIFPTDVLECVYGAMDYFAPKNDKTTLPNVFVINAIMMSPGGRSDIARAAALLRRVPAGAGFQAAPAATRMMVWC